MNKFKSLIFVLVYGVLFSQPSIGYDEEEDYTNHQIASHLFFKKSPKNPEAQAILRKFLGEFASSPQVSPIKLDGLCPRSRIILLRSIAQTIFEKSKIERLKQNGNINSPRLGVEITYFFGNTRSVVRYSPTDTDPGHLTIKNLNYQILWKGLNNHHNRERSREVANIFFNGYKQLTPCKQEHLNKTILFFDFEIARNLIGDELDNRMKIIPIASAIVNFLELAKENDNYQISQFFEEREMKEVVLVDKDSEKYAHESAMEWEEEVLVEERYDGYNPFGGDLRIRESATKRILAEMHKVKEEWANGDTISETSENILTRYYNFFGGSHEDGEYEEN